jgi:hypothetical protein
MCEFDRFSPTHSLQIVHRQLLNIHPSGWSWARATRTARFGRRKSYWSDRTAEHGAGVRRARAALAQFKDAEGQPGIKERALA